MIEKYRLQTAPLHHGYGKNGEAQKVEKLSFYHFGDHHLGNIGKE
jgi:hypothetical protein